MIQDQLAQLKANRGDLEVLFCAIDMSSDEGFKYWNSIPVAYCSDRAVNLMVLYLLCSEEYPHQHAHCIESNLFARRSW